MSLLKKIEIPINGPGIIMYSDFAVKNINKGENYFENSYLTSEQVLKHVYEGSIVGFCTPIPGYYTIEIYNEKPEDYHFISCKYKLYLGIEVRDKRIFIGDLYDLACWNPQYLKEESIELDNGFYEVYVLTDPLEMEPEIEDYEQTIEIYFSKTDSMPKLKYNGTPLLANPDETYIEFEE